MRNVFKQILKRSLATFCIFLGCLILFCVVFGGALIIGLPGHWFDSLLDKTISKDVGSVRFNMIAYKLHHGLIIDKPSLTNAEGRCLVKASSVELDLQLLTLKQLSERLQRIVLNDLFVAQIQWADDTQIDEIDTPHAAFPDLSSVVLPQFNNVQITITNPDILEVKLDYCQGTLQTLPNGILKFSNLEGAVAETGESIDASLIIDIHDAKISSHIRGSIYQTRINGIYRALNFPLIETYSNYFKLNAPVWADATFTVGLDKWRDLFKLKIDLLSHAGGSYCDVPFDEIEGTISCEGVFTAVTKISPIVVKRKGSIVATGNLRFDCPENKFLFDTKGEGLSPKECFKIINMPFTEVIPSIQCEHPPEINFSGNIPLFTEQSPEFVTLSGSLKTPTSCTVDKLTFGSFSTELQMKEGVFSLFNLVATLPTQGSIKGRMDITIPQTAEYTDINTKLDLEDAALKDLLAPFNYDLLPDSLAKGFIDFSCRTDDTFKSSIHGLFDLALSGGLIERLPIFAGFTDIMTKYIPFLTAITDSSDVTLTGTIHKGYLQMPDFRLTGTLFSIEGPVNYNIVNDQIDANVIGGVFKKGTTMGVLTRWLSVPFYKFLLQIHVDGPIAKPEWHVVSLVEKLLNFSSSD